MTNDRADGVDERAPKRRSFIEEARRAQIVQAAIETIAEVGYAKATFARIAERANVSPALISYHFAGKSELMNQVVAHITGAMEDAITAEMGDAESYAAALRGVIEAQVRYFGEHVTEVRALGQIFASGSDDPDDGADQVSGSYPPSRAKTLGEFEEMFREGQDRGEFRAFSPRTMAVTLLDALEGVPREMFNRPDTDAGAYGRELADLFARATSA